MSSLATPINHIKGEKIIPKIVSNENWLYGVLLAITVFNPDQPPIQPKV